MNNKSFRRIDFLLCSKKMIIKLIAGRSRKVSPVIFVAYDKAESIAKIIK